MPAHSEEVERYTPLYVLEGLGTMFDLDPCSPPVYAPSKLFCKKGYVLSLGQDGLVLPWPKEDLVWLNPPWTRGEKRKWVMKLKEHGNGIALVRGGVDSAWLHDSRPDALFLLRGRVKYLRPDGAPERLRKGGAVGGFEPSMLLGFGDRAVETLSRAKLEGMFYQHD
jgi:hypothetical protein